MALCSKCARFGKWIHSFHNARVISMPSPCLWCLICIIILCTLFCAFFFSMISFVPVAKQSFCLLFNPSKLLTNFPALIEACQYSDLSGSRKPRTSFSMASSAAPTGCTISYVTVPDMEVAKKISDALVESEWAACVNIVPGIQSVYKWKGNIERNSELLLVIKSRQERFQEMNSKIKALHPYEVCEVISMPIIDGNPDYLKWIHECVPTKKEPKELS